MNPDNVPLKDKQLALELAESVRNIGPLDPNRLPTILPQNIQSVINQYNQGHGTPHIAQEVISAFSSADRANVSYNFLKGQNSIPLPAFIGALNSFAFSEYPKHLEADIARTSNPTDPTVSNKPQTPVTPKEAVQMAKAAIPNSADKPPSKPENNPPAKPKPPEKKPEENKEDKTEQKTEKEKEPSEVKLEDINKIEPPKTEAIPQPPNSQPTPTRPLPRPPIPTPVSRRSYNPFRNTATRIQRVAVRAAPVISRTAAPLTTTLRTGTQRLTRVGLPRFIQGLAGGTGGGLGGIIRAVINPGGNGGGDNGGGGKSNNNGSRPGFLSRNPLGGAKKALDRAPRNLATRLKKGSVVFYILMIIIIMVILGGIFGFFGDSAKTGNDGKIVITKTGDTAVTNGSKINYQITVKNEGAGSAAKIVVTDTIPADTKYESGDNDKEAQGSTITEARWTVSNLSPGQSKVLNLTVIPLKPDFWVTNTAKSSYSLSGESGGTLNGLPIDPSSLAGVNDFNQLMKGQGRNTASLGDENSFVSKIMSVGAFGLKEQESSLREIFKTALAKNTSPILILTLWGTESGFAFNQTPFGCDPPREDGSGGKYPGFHENLACSAGTQNFWMTEFEKNNKDGRYEINPKCIYDDATIFSMEKYGPVCSASDGNENHRQNFVKIYKQLLGI